jgi:alpha-N-arabinofuranosidase
MPPIVSVNVDTTGSMGQVSPRIFGTFIEPIDWSINNGVMAEILVNGSLEGGLWNHAMLEPIFKDEPELVQSTNQTGIPIPWQALNKAAGNRYELHVGHAANSWQSLEVMGVPGELTGIKQRVYLPVPRAWKYNVSLYAKHIDGPAALEVSLREHGTATGLKFLGSAHIAIASGDWKKYTATIELKPGSMKRLEPIDFAISVEGTERVELDEISLMPADAVDGLFDPAVLKLSADMHMTELRFGGNFSSYYHWRDGAGPIDQRVAMENIAWGIPEYNNFGTDEFLKYSELVHAEPQFDINEGSGSPSEAVDWIKYIRERYHGPMIVEMGNELYGRWQVGFPTIDQVGPRTLDFSKALKPLMGDNTTLLATGDGPVVFEKWNAKQLANPSGTYDLLTMHFIVGTNHVKLNPHTPDFMAAAAYAVPFQFGKQVDAMAEQKNAVKDMKDTHFAVAEWLFNNKGDGERHFENVSPSSRNQGGAVMVALAFNEFFRHNREIKLADMTGLMEFAGIWKRKEQTFVSPPYFVFQMYQTARNETVLPVSTDSGTYSVMNGIQDYADVNDIPYIDVAATKSADGKSLTLFAVNRSLTEDQPLRFNLGPFQFGGRVEVEQIASKDRLAMNTEETPDNVTPKLSTITIDLSQPLQITLPHETVTVLRLRSK